MPRLKVSFFTFIAIFYLLLYFDRFSLISVLLSITVHEAAHLIFIYAFGCRIESISVTPLGVSIRRKEDSGSLIKELFIYLSGPAVSIIMFFICIAHGDHETGYISLFYGVINLIPVKIFDGGKALDIILFELCPAESGRIMRVINCVFILLIWTVSVFLMIYCGEFFQLFFLSVYLFIKLFIYDKI